MCVSTAYFDKEGTDVLADYVATVRIDGDSVIMTDVMGKETVVKGTLREADLTRGILILNPA